MNIILIFQQILTYFNSDDKKIEYSFKLLLFQSKFDIHAD